jgi:RNA polymerase-binding transcription factor DksA
MPEYDRKQVEARLDERQSEIDARRAGLREGAEARSEELADYDQHPGDQGSETYQQELDETTGMILDEEESRIKQARQALENGKYGVCVDCGKDIPAARLDAIPESVRCVEDQRIYEARLKQQGGPAATH